MSGPMFPPEYINIRSVVEGWSAQAPFTPSGFSPVLDRQLVRQLHHLLRAHDYYATKVDEIRRAVQG